MVYYFPSYLINPRYLILHTIIFCFSLINLLLFFLFLNTLCCSAFVLGLFIFIHAAQCLVDLILGVVLIFYIHEIFLGCVIWGIISAVVAVKDREVDLFQEVFVGGISSGDGSNGMMGGGAIPSPADGMVQGAYHSV